MQKPKLNARVGRKLNRHSGTRTKKRLLVRPAKKQNGVEPLKRPNIELVTSRSHGALSRGFTVTRWLELITYCGTRAVA
jgi:hypothetical protein